MVHPMKKSLAITAAAASPQAKVVFVVFAFNTSPASCPPFQGVSHLLSYAPSEVQCPIHPPGWLLPQVTPSSSSSPLMLEVPFFFFFFGPASIKIYIPKCSAAFGTDYRDFHRRVNEAEVELSLPWLAYGGLQPGEGSPCPGPQVPRSLVCINLPCSGLLCCQEARFLDPPSSAECSGKWRVFVIAWERVWSMNSILTQKPWRRKHKSSYVTKFCVLIKLPGPQQGCFFKKKLSHFWFCSCKYITTLHILLRFGPRV